MELSSYSAWKGLSGSLEAVNYSRLAIAVAAMELQEFGIDLALQSLDLLIIELN